jgi:hypothetical protein
VEDEDEQEVVKNDAREDSGGQNTSLVCRDAWLAREHRPLILNHMTVRFLKQ